MPEIVIPDLSHAVCLEKLRKALCDIMRLDQIANLIDTYILKIFLDVAASAQAAVFCCSSFCVRSLSRMNGTRGSVLILDLVFVVSDATRTRLPSRSQEVTV